MFKETFLKSKSILEIIIKTIFALITINFIYMLLIFSGNIFLDNDSADGTIFLIGNIVLIILSIRLGCVIKKNNYQLIFDNRLKKVYMIVSFMLAYGTFHFFFIRASGMNIASDTILYIRDYMEVNSINSNAFTRFLIHIVDQFFLWTPVNVTACLGAVFNCFSLEHSKN